jgi:hypothetical protein
VFGAQQAHDAVNVVGVQLRRGRGTAYLRIE